VNFTEENEEKNSQNNWGQNDLGQNNCGPREAGKKVSFFRAKWICGVMDVLHI
jgi:hypothetical protein